MPKKPPSKILKEAEFPKEGRRKGPLPWEGKGGSRNSRGKKWKASIFKIGPKNVEGQKHGGTTAQGSAGGKDLKNQSDEISPSQRTVAKKGARGRRIRCRRGGGRL